MLINDGKGSNYTETVVTPDGKAKQYKGRNVVVDAPKGTKVFTHDQWQTHLNSILIDAGIGFGSKNMPEINMQNGITEEVLDGVMGKYFGNMQTNVLNIDKDGFNDYIVRGGQKTNKLNRRVTFRGLRT